MQPDVSASPERGVSAAAKIPTARRGVMPPVAANGLPRPLPVPLFGMMIQLRLPLSPSRFLTAVVLYADQAILDRLTAWRRAGGASSTCRCASRTALASVTLPLPEAVLEPHHLPRPTYEIAAAVPCCRDPLSAPWRAHESRLATLSLFPGQRLALDGIAA